MKHSSNSISGINMSSNENDAMRWNDVLVDTNILICYTLKTEPRMMSNYAMKMPKQYWGKKDLDELDLAQI